MFHFVLGKNIIAHNLKSLAILYMISSTISYLICTIFSPCNKPTQSQIFEKILKNAIQIYFSMGSNARNEQEGKTIQMPIDENQTQKVIPVIPMFFFFFGQGCVFSQKSKYDFKGNIAILLGSCSLFSKTLSKPKKCATFV